MHRTACFRWSLQLLPALCSQFTTHFVTDGEKTPNQNQWAAIGRWCPARFIIVTPNFLDACLDQSVRVDDTPYRMMRGPSGTHLVPDGGGVGGGEMPFFLAAMEPSQQHHAIALLTQAVRNYGAQSPEVQADVVAKCGITDNQFHQLFQHCYGCRLSRVHAVAEADAARAAAETDAAAKMTAMEEQQAAMEARMEEQKAAMEAKMAEQIAEQQKAAAAEQQKAVAAVAAAEERARRAKAEAADAAAKIAAAEAEAKRQQDEQRAATIAAQLAERKAMDLQAAADVRRKPAAAAEAADRNAKQQAEAAAAVKAAAAKAAAAKQAKLPAGWTSSVNPSSGRTFYINSLTKTRTLEVPTAAATVPEPEPTAESHESAAKVGPASAGGRGCR